MRIANCGTWSQYFASANVSEQRLPSRVTLRDAEVKSARGRATLPQRSRKERDSHIPRAISAYLCDICVINMV